jgi:hypothetical protein
MHAMVEGKQRVFISDFAPKELRGMAFGTFHTVIGLATLPLGTFTGALWRYVKPTATFLYGLILMLLRQR